MDKKVKWVAIAFIALLLSLVFAFHPVSISADGCAATPPHERMIEYPFPVVAAVYDYPVPDLPDPAPQPSGFNFTFQNATDRSIVTGADFGNVTLHPDVIAVPEAENFMPVMVNITNLLGYDIIIQNLNAAVTFCDPKTDPFWFPYAQPPKWWGNFSCVQLDTLDRAVDEVNYYTMCTGCAVTMCTGWCSADDSGAQENHPMANGTVFGPNVIEGMCGEYSLLEPDMGGDARATGHVAPVKLMAGATFTEYFAAWVFGNLSYTGPYPIRGTITLRLYYKPVRLNLHAEPAVTGNPVCTYWNTTYHVVNWIDDDASGSLTVDDQILLNETATKNVSWWHVDSVTQNAPTSTDIVVTQEICELVVNVLPKVRGIVVDQGYRTWTVSLEATVKNIGNVKINCTISAYYYTGTTWIQIGTSQSVTNLGNWTQTTLTWSWSLAGLPLCSKSIKVNGTCVCKEGLMCYGFEFFGHYEQYSPPELPYSPRLKPVTVKVKKTGNVNNDGATDIADIILCCINLGNVPPKPIQLDINADGLVDIADIIICCINLGPETC